MRCYPAYLEPISFDHKSRLAMFVPPHLNQSVQISEL